MAQAKMGDPRTTRVVDPKPGQCADGRPLHQGSTWNAGRWRSDGQPAVDRVAAR